MLTPLKRPTFRTLWAGMGLSYAGDRLQELAQGWLVATLTDSALAVSGIGALNAIPMLFMPLGGVVADQANRRRIILTGQWVGALTTGMAMSVASTGCSPRSRAYRRLIADRLPVNSLCSKRKQS